MDAPITKKKPTKPIENPQTKQKNKSKTRAGLSATIMFMRRGRIWH